MIAVTPRTWAPRSAAMTRPAPSSARRIATRAVVVASAPATRIRPYALASASTRRAARRASPSTPSHARARATKRRSLAQPRTQQTSTIADATACPTAAMPAKWARCVLSPSARAFPSGARRTRSAHWRAGTSINVPSTRFGMVPDDARTQAWRALPSRIARAKARRGSGRQARAALLVVRLQRVVRRPARRSLSFDHRRRRLACWGCSPQRRRRGVLEREKQQNGGDKRGCSSAALSVR